MNNNMDCIKFYNAYCLGNFSCVKNTMREELLKDLYGHANFDQHQAIINNYNLYNIAYFLFKIANLYCKNNHINIYSVKQLRETPYKICYPYCNVCVRLCQKQAKALLKKTKASRIIQKACDNWLYKPVTKDGKLGINCRLGFKHLNDLDEAPFYLSD